MAGQVLIVLLEQGTGSPRAVRSAKPGGGTESFVSQKASLKQTLKGWESIWGRFGWVEKGEKAPLSFSSYRLTFKAWVIVWVKCPIISTTSSVNECE